MHECRHVHDVDDYEGLDQLYDASFLNALLLLEALRINPTVAVTFFTKRIRFSAFVLLPSILFPGL